MYLWPPAAVAVATARPHKLQPPVRQPSRAPLWDTFPSHVLLRVPPAVRLAVELGRLHRAPLVLRLTPHSLRVVSPDARLLSVPIERAPLPTMCPVMAPVPRQPPLVVERLPILPLFAPRLPP